MEDWPKILHIYRDGFDFRKEYEKAVREAKSHYDHSVRVSGGWIFFERQEDYSTWLFRR